MRLNMDCAALEKWLAQCEDAEALGDGEYTVDLYDVDSPLSVELAITRDGAELLAALELMYSEEMEGWYLGERRDDAELVCAMLNQAMQADQ